jgi:hypothetical protein
VARLSSDPVIATLLDLDRNLRRLDHLVQGIRTDSLESWRVDAIYESLARLSEASEKLWEKRRFQTPSGD